MSVTHSSAVFFFKEKHIWGAAFLSEKNADFAGIVWAAYVLHSGSLLIWHYKFELYIFWNITNKKNWHFIDYWWN